MWSPHVSHGAVAKSRATCLKKQKIRATQTYRSGEQIEGEEELNPVCSSAPPPSLPYLSTPTVGACCMIPSGQRPPRAVLGRTWTPHGGRRPMPCSDPNGSPWRAVPHGARRRPQAAATLGGAMARGGDPRRGLQVATPWPGCEALGMAGRDSKVRIAF